MGGPLSWLEFNIRRALGESVADADEQQLSLYEVSNTLTTLQLMDANMDKCSAWLKELGLT